LIVQFQKIFISILTKVIGNYKWDRARNAKEISKLNKLGISREGQGIKTKKPHMWETNCSTRNKTQISVVISPPHRVEDGIEMRSQHANQSINFYTYVFSANLD